MPATTDDFQTRQGRREQYLRRFSTLQSVRSRYDDRWRDIDQALLPVSSRFYALDTNRVDARWNDIIDNSGAMALDRLVGGLMSYGTSPARPWMQFRVADVDLNGYKPVTDWLHIAAKRTLDVFDRSNTYQALPQYYEQGGAYGTACGLLLADAQDIIRHYPVPIGEFWLATDYRGDVVTMYRRFAKTVGETVTEFGYDNCSTIVKSQWKRGEVDNQVVICHAIEPRTDRDVTRQDQLNMAWRSVYFEESGQQDQVLREGGFDHFPVLSPRWKVRPGDVYASDWPGARALGDIRQLQHEQTHKADVLNMIVDPSVQVPTALQNRHIETMPGGRNYYDQQTAHGGIRRTHESPIDLSGLLEDLNDVRGRIDRAFYADLFAMLSMVSDTTQRTAAEIEIRNEEKMAMLGPVSRQHNRELRAPLINITFRHLLEGGHLPPPPPELNNVELDVEFLDVFSQAQKQIGTVAVDRFLGVVFNLQQAGAPALDLIDIDETVKDYADRYAINPKIVLSSDDPRVTEIRKARAAAQAAQAQVAMAQQQAGTVKDLAASPVGTGTALDQLTGYQGMGGA